MSGGVGGDVPEVPEEVRRLACEREAARGARDFAAADALRERIRAAGFEVTDTGEGPVLSAAPPVAGTVGERTSPRRRPAEVPSLLDRPAEDDVSVHWIVEGWQEDVLRGIASFDRHHPDVSARHVVVDIRGGESGAWPEGVDLVALEPGTGWAAARNAGLTRTLGRLVLVVDGSVEFVGDAVSPLAAALAEPRIGLSGPFGIATEDLRSFHESDGPEVDAVEGYLMAFGRELLLGGLRFDEGFRFYRTADIELSFQVKARGLRVTVTPAPVLRHQHRMWATTPKAERDRLSKRNFYRFLDRWRGREDLLVSRRRAGA